jgi:Uma2 family endonuclease
MATTSKLMLDEFLRMEETKPALEYACGEVWQKPMPNRLHSAIQTYLASVMVQLLDRTGLGQVFVELRCIFGPPGRERAFVPDLVYIAKERLTADLYHRAAPDLAVEVLSPDQDMTRFLDKIQFYLLNGVRLVWVFDPEKATVVVLMPGQEAVVLASGATLDGGDVLPDFSVALDDMFARLRV